MTTSVWCLMLRELVTVPVVEHKEQTYMGTLFAARAVEQRLYDAAIASHNEQANNTPMNSSCSYKWWETLKS